MDNWQPLIPCYVCCILYVQIPCYCLFLFMYQVILLDGAELELINDIVYADSHCNNLSFVQPTCSSLCGCHNNILMIHFYNAVLSSVPTNKYI